MTVRRTIRYGSLGYLALILIAPVGLIFWRAFEHGLAPFWHAISNPTAVHALKLTVEVTLAAVPLNTVFGILCGLAIVRHRFPGMGLVNALVDLTTARCLGEFGAVAIVSGGIAGRTQTLTQYVQASYENFDQTGAYAASVLLAALAIATLVLMTMFRPREEAHGNRGA